MNKEICVVKATAADLKEVVEIELQCFDSDGFSRRQLRYLITCSKGACYVLKNKGKIAGYISLLAHARRSNLRIYSLAVSPENRGRGFARTLLEQAVRYALHNHSAAITLEVRTDNPVALALYEKSGFFRTALLRDYYHDHSDAYKMKLSLEDTNYKRVK